MRFVVRLDGAQSAVAIERGASGWRVVVDDQEFEVQVERTPDGGWRARTDGADVLVERRARAVRVDGAAAEVEVVGLARGAGAGEAHAGGEVRPPMPGRIRAVLVREGDEVQAGQPLVVLEAMKMQNEIPAPVHARVAQVLAREGATVEPKDVLVVLERL